MTQEQKWILKYNEVVEFIEANHRNPSKHNDDERYRYLNWIKHNRHLMNKGELKEPRLGMFKELLALCEQNRRKNQYQ